uniref:inorganic diphosphatase n=1 Tax=Eubacterium cellulosolvens TaxID=29322 RepID=UPI00192E7401|nr:inorganic diphosphatase [[Eubacterium] cellulosolvens]
MQSIIGKTVRGKIDRPIGSFHPRFPDMIYPVNYGYIEGVIAGDGEEQDAYVLGTDKPLDEFQGKVIAVYHRFNDVEDKWIVSLDGSDYSDDEILQLIHFQEQYYEGELVR